MMGWREAAREDKRRASPTVEPLAVTAALAWELGWVRDNRCDVTDEDYRGSGAVAAVRLNRFPSYAIPFREEQLLQPLLVVERRPVRRTNCRAQRTVATNDLLSRDKLLVVPAHCGGIIAAPSPAARGSQIHQTPHPASVGTVRRREAHDG